MDPRGFFRAMESRPPFILQSGLLSSLHGLNGINPLASINGITLEFPPNAFGRSKLAREEAILEAKVVQIIVSGEWETLKPNSGRSVAVGGHHICVAYHDDTNSGVRIWEWHGHILMFDDETGYTPEYVYGHYFQPLQRKHDLDDGNVNVVNGVGLTGLINSDDKTNQVVHRNAQKAPSTSRLVKK